MFVILLSIVSAAGLEPAPAATLFTTALFLYATPNLTTKKNLIKICIHSQC